MKSIFLTSNFSFYDSEKKKALKITNKEFIEDLKRNIYGYDSVLFICSDPYDYKKNQKISELVLKSLSLSGIKFNKSDFIDSRNALFVFSLINNSNLVVILDGDYATQSQFFIDIDLKEKLRMSKTPILTMNTSTLNACDYVYISGNGVDSSKYYKGLGLINLVLETNFEINNEAKIDNVYLKDSKHKAFIALPKDSYITIEDKKKHLYGDAYYFKDGTYHRISNLDNL